MWFRRLLHRWRRRRRERRLYPLIFRPTFEGRSDVYHPSVADPSAASERQDGKSPDQLLAKESRHGR